MDCTYPVHLTAIMSKVMDGTTLVQEDKAVAKTATTYTATGLTEGKAYSFEVMAVSGTEMSTVQSKSLGHRQPEQAVPLDCIPATTTQREVV
jgi:hypothetical protein